MVKSTIVVFFSLILTLFSAFALAETEVLGGTAVSKHKKIHSGKSHAKKTSRTTHHLIIGKSAHTSKAHATYAVKRTVWIHGKRRVVYGRLPHSTSVTANAVPTMGDLAGLKGTPDSLALQSNVALVLDQANSEILFAKNSGIALPIASITKLMTGLVVVEANQDMDEVLTVSEEDIDRERKSSSRLRVGATLTRTNMLHIALMSSENRAAAALGRNFVGGLPAFVLAMNAKAKELGMTDTHYVDSTGLSSRNIASANDLAKLVIAVQRYPILCQYSTDTKYIVNAGGRQLQYQSSNRLVANPDWEIGLQKTGYIAEAGRCLVMQAKIAGRAVVMVFLDSKGKYSRLADAGRIRTWLSAKKPEI